MDDYHHLQSNFNNMSPSMGMNDYIEIQSIYEPNPVPINVSSFDSQQELLWTGNTEVNIFLKRIFFWKNFRIYFLN